MKKYIALIMMLFVLTSCANNTVDPKYLEEPAPYEDTGRDESQNASETEKMVLLTEKELIELCGLTDAECEGKDLSAFINNLARIPLPLQVGDDWRFTLIKINNITTNI